MHYLSIKSYLKKNPSFHKVYSNSEKLISQRISIVPNILFQNSHSINFILESISKISFQNTLFQNSEMFPK